jgi:predicted permease
MAWHSLQALADILLQVLAPIVLMAGAGFWLQRKVGVEPKNINRIVYFVLSPCLVYTSILGMDIDTSIAGRIILFAALNMLLMGLAAYGLARRAGYEGGLASAFIFTNIQLNNGNYGLPLNLFAFGAVGFAYALLFFMFNTVIGGATSIYLAINGQSDSLTALQRTIRQPIILAISLSLFSRLTHIAPSGSMLDMLDMAGKAAIPVFLLVLGMSLAKTDVRLNLKPVLRLTTLRMLASPLLALVLAMLTGLTGPAFSVGILQASMPSAVNTIVISNEFDAAPDFTAGAVLMTTLASLITLPILLFFLR